MSRITRFAGTLLTLCALAVAATAIAAPNGKGQAQERVFTLQPDPAGNPEGIAYQPRSRSFFVGITADGAIYRGTTDSDTVSPFISGAAGQSAVGMKVRGNRLYVAGGMTGTITVYDLSTKQAIATFQTGADGFLNDLVVTRNGDAWVTDSSVRRSGTSRASRCGPAVAHRRRSISPPSSAPRPKTSTPTGSSPSTATGSSSSTRRPERSIASTCARVWRRPRRSRAFRCRAAMA